MIISEEKVLQAAGRAVGYILAVTLIAGVLLTAIGALRLLGMAVLR